MTNCNDTHLGYAPGELSNRSGHTLGGALGDLWQRMREASARRREKAHRDWVRRTTELEIAKLSPELRKDIGWPNRYEE